MTSNKPIYNKSINIHNIKAGDKVRIKGFDWYNANKDEDGNVLCSCNTLFLHENDWCLGHEFKVRNVFECIGIYKNQYCYELDGIEGYDFVDDIIECKL